MTPGPLDALERELLDLAKSIAMEVGPYSDVWRKKVTDAIDTFYEERAKLGDLYRRNADADGLTFMHRLACRASWRPRSESEIKCDCGLDEVEAALLYLASPSFVKRVASERAAADVLLGPARIPIDYGLRADCEWSGCGWSHEAFGSDLVALRRSFNEACNGHVQRASPFHVGIGGVRVSMLSATYDRVLSAEEIAKHWKDGTV